jgi:tetratricopeptide (TPR) repeat protein
LSDNCSTDRTRVIEQLKYKADYLYAQRQYAEAVKYYEQLSEIIPPSNSVLTQEVCESRILCLTAKGKSDEAEKSLKEMVWYVW